MSFPRINISEAPSGGTSVNTLPNAGQKVMAESLSVTVASDQILSVAGVVQVGNWPISGLSVSFPSAQHVIIDSMPAGGAATDVTDRSARLLGHVTVDNASLAVTGTFWQATQPVSGTFWQATQPVSLATNTPDVTDRSARLLGHVTVDNASLAVTGSFWQATQPVSGTFWQATQPVSLATNTPDVTDRSARLLGHVTVDNASLAVTGTFWQATQPVSGTVTANAGTNLNTSALALDATLTGGTQQAKITDGTNIATVKAASTLPAATDKAVVVTARDSIAVTGTFWQATQPVSGTFWQATQPVSGTVTANAGTNLNTSALALDATLTGGTQRTKITDGTNNAAVKAASTAPVATDPALVVAWSPNMAPSSVSLLPSAAATINATVVKASAGRLFKIKGYNAAAAVRYLKFWNKATTPAPASDAALIVFSFALKASDQFDIDLTPLGYSFSTGIGYTISTGSANTDVAAVTAADIVGLNIMYA